MNLKRKQPVVFVLNKQGHDLSSVQQKIIEPEIEEEEDIVELPEKRQKTEDEQDTEDEKDTEESVKEEPTNANKQATLVVDKYKLRMYLRLYQQWFPDKLQGIDFQNIDELEVEELKELHSKIKFLIGAENCVAFNHKVLQFGIQVFENLGRGFLDLQIDGLAQVCDNDPAMESILKEIALDNMVRFNYTNNNILGKRLGREFTL